MEKIKKTLFAIIAMYKNAQIKLSGMVGKKKSPKDGGVDEYNYTIF